MAMDPKLKREWVKALRSGEYEQGTSALCRKGKFCCLGVAYDVLVDGEWERSSASAYADTWGVPSGSGTHNAWLPGDVARDIGLYDGVSDYQGVLMAMNDRGDSFAEIADWIEANL